VNVTFAPDAIDVGNVGRLVNANTVPGTLIELSVNTAEPVLLIVNEVKGVAAVPTGAEPTNTAVELSVTIAVTFCTCNEGVDAGIPVTSKFNTNDAVVGSLVTIVIVPGFEPTAAGFPVTVNVAEPPATTVVGMVGSADIV
jgi:choline-glycine betaine transporter